MHRMKLWQKNYTLDKQIEDFTVEEDYILDLQLVKYDCLASIAHARMLHKIGILSQADLKLLLRELNNLMELDQKGQFTISKEEEDCHTAIENHLIGTCGDAGKMIHTFRSRNDQVLTALRLLYKDKLKEIQDLIVKVNQSIAVFKGKNAKVVIPGFTHTRKAMPSSIGLWSKAIMDSMKDNQKMLVAVFDLIDQSPLGTGAGYGIPYAIDRQYTSKLLGFAQVQENPIYAQSSRGKFEAVILDILAMIMFDINKMASDLILFTMPQFGFFELPDEFLTGSSIMPHKKNPDVLELLRANYHLLLADESRIKGVMANLISGYHRDLQLTKAPILHGLAITKKSIVIVNLIFKNLKVNKKQCQQAVTADLFTTAKTYRLVGQGIPFRDAYKEVARESFKVKTSNKKKTRR
jgi:argininosuccinate lyase